MNETVYHKLNEMFILHIPYWNTNMIQNAVYNAPINGRLTDVFLCWIEHFILLKIQYEYLEFTKIQYLHNTNFNANKRIDDIISKITIQFMANIDKTISEYIENRCTQKQLNRYQMEEIYFRILLNELDNCLSKDSFDIVAYVAVTNV